MEQRLAVRSGGAGTMSRGDCSSFGMEKQRQEDDDQRKAGQHLQSVGLEDQWLRTMPDADPCKVLDDSDGKTSI
ncbi:hypothetical protein MRB53_038671 [Persea americana]|nr:hypothetical protein MRB53_038671 [Persea americana]